MTKKVADRFFRDVGALVFWFSNGEGIIYLIAQHLLGGRHVAIHVLKTYHLDKTLELVKSLARELYPDSSARRDFEAGLVAFKKCAAERNELLHSVCFPIEQHGAGLAINVTNARAMKSMAREATHVTELTDRVRHAAMQFLNAASFDADV